MLGFKASVTADTTGILATWAGDDCCGAWEGVACGAATGRVVALQLEAPPPQQHYMEGTLSPSLGGLEFLEAMVIRDMGRIGGAIPESLSRLAHLGQLYLEGNMIAGGIPGSLRKMSSLQFLSLAGNRLEGQLPLELGAVPGLEKINLARNRLAGSVPLSYRNLPRLAYLDLSNNPLSGAVPGFLGQFKSLTLVDLSNNTFSGEIPASLRALRNLTDLSLSPLRIPEGSEPDPDSESSSRTPRAAVIFPTTPVRPYKRAASRVKSSTLIFSPEALTCLELCRRFVESPPTGRRRRRSSPPDFVVVEAPPPASSPPSGSPSLVLRRAPVSVPERSSDRRLHLRP